MGNEWKKLLMSVAEAYLCIMFVFAGMRVYAEETGKIQEITFVNGKCIAYVVQNQGTVFHPDIENSCAKINGKNCKIEKIEFAEGQPVVYDCLIDISGSMDQARIDEAKKILYQFAEGKKDQDVIRITRMGDERYSSEFLTNRQQIEAVIDEIAVTGEDTNLYGSLKEELDELKNGEESIREKCLIVFSDGAEDQKTGITREEAESAVRESGIPVYTVAMLKERATQDDVEAAKILGSFARTSFKGIHFAPMIDDLEYDQVYERIVSSVKGNLVVTIDVQDISGESGKSKLSLVLDDGNEKVSMETDIDEETVLLWGKEAEQQENQWVETEKEEIRTNEIQDVGKRISVKLIVLFAAIAIVLVLCLIVIFALAKKNRKISTDKALSAECYGTEYLQKLKIVLHNSKTNETSKAILEDRLLIGRGVQCEICLEEDAALSEIHCALEYRGGCVYLTDLESTNGSYVNGVPILYSKQLNASDVLLLGSSEYVITWR